jgi:hypothetical protein
MQASMMANNRPVGLSNSLLVKPNTTNLRNIYRMFGATQADLGNQALVQFGDESVIQVREQPQAGLSRQDSASVRAPLIRIDRAPTPVARDDSLHPPASSFGTGSALLAEARPTSNDVSREYFQMLQSFLNHR